MRRLPAQIITSAVDEKPTLEALRVQEKYSNASAAIGESNIDYVALNYMNAHAALYWLPRFLSYVKVEAPKDSYHYEALLLNLSDEQFSRRLISALTDDEQRLIEAFFDWLQAETSFLTGSALRQNDYVKAREIWASSR